MSHHTRFTAQEHGFQFVNYFEYKLPFLRRPLSFGLCGGMCHGALDYYRTGGPVPETGMTPAQGTPLYGFLVRRQVASMSGWSVLPCMARWLFTRQERLDVLSIQEWPKVRAQLDMGLPVVLLLIRTERWEKPTDNHQVLALGYDLAEDGHDLDIAIYDPGYPCEKVWLHMRLGDPSGGLDLRHSRSGCVRGFFATRYRPAQPPPAQVTQRIVSQ